MTAILTIAPPNAASGRPTAEPPPGTTVKELALAVDRTREDCQRVQTLRWLRPGPFSGLIVQAHFQVPFKREECSPDPVETLAAVYLKLRRHWPQMVGDGAWWLVGVMRAWWGGLPKPAGTEVPGRDLPVEEDDEEDDEPDDPIVGSVRVDFSTAGAYTSVPITRDYRADIEFDDDDISTMEIIRERFRVGEISRDSARRLVQNLINELVKAQFENGEAEETDTRYGDICDGDDYFDDEAVGDDDIESYGPACDIVRCW